MSEHDPLLEALATKAGLWVVKFSAEVLADFPALKDAVYVRVLGAAERHLYGATALHAQTEGEYISDYEIVAICACKADGTPRFHKVDEHGRIQILPEHVNRLRLVDGRAVHAIANKALEVSGMFPDAATAAKKNSLTTSSDDSSSDSP